MKQTFKAIVVSFILFTIGMFISIAIPEVGAVFVIVGGVALVVTCCIYLFFEYKHIRDLEAIVDYKATPLPQEEIRLNSKSGFIYPDMLQNLPKAYDQVRHSGMNEFYVNVLYRGTMIMQIINVPDTATGETENIGVFFFPYMYEDKDLVERFAHNDFICYFDDEIYSDEGTSAYFGHDLKLAMQVASYILATVYYIPTNEHLTIKIDAA